MRKEASIGQLPNIKYAKKLIDTPVADYDSDLNVIVLRHADVILMLAEALNEVGYSSAGRAFELLNEIRNRAGLAPLNT